MDNLIVLILDELTHNEDFRKAAIPHIKREYFEDDAQKIIFDTIRYYTEKYSCSPTQEALVLEVQRHKHFNLDVGGDIESIINAWDEEVDQSEEWMLDETEKWCQDRAIYLALTESIKISRDKSAGVSRGGIPDLLRDALSVNFDSSVGLDYFDDTEHLYEFYHTKENKMPFDLDILNKITDGGVPDKTLNLIMGGTGSGKSMWLCALAAGYLMQGKNVIYISLEMSEEQVAERIDANLLDMEISKLKKLNKETYFKLADKVKGKSNGKLIVKQYPTAGAHTGHFRHLINEMKIKKNIKPDVIIIDYLNICASSRVKMGGSVNTYSLVKSIAEEIRGLGVENCVPVWSATQSNRSALGSSDVDLDNTSESIGTAATVDFFMALISTDELEEMGQQIVKILKNRYGSTHAIRKFTVNIDRYKMKITEAEYRNYNDVENENDFDTGNIDTTDYTGFKI